MESSTDRGKTDAYTVRVFEGASLVLLAPFFFAPVLAVRGLVEGRMAPSALLAVPATFALIWTLARGRTTVTVQGIEVVPFLWPARRYEWDEIEGFLVGYELILMETRKSQHPVLLPGAKSRSLLAARRASRLQEILAAIRSFNPKARPAASS